MAVTPGIEGTLGLGGYGKLFGRLSGVYTFTGGGLDGAGTNPPPHTHPSTFLLEDAHLRWTSGGLMPFFGNDGVEVSAGAQRFRPVGSGFLVWGGSSNGGRRGAFWLGARRAFENTGVLRLRKDDIRADFFYLTPNDNPNTNTDVVGTNLEYDITKSTQVGFMYLNVLNSDRVRRDGLNVFNFRGKTAPLSSLPGLQFDGELALEENGSKVNSALGGYMRESVMSLRSYHGNLASAIVLPASAATGAAKEPTRPSIRCFTAKATGAPGSRAKSSAITSPSIKTC